MISIILRAEHEEEEELSEAVNAVDLSDGVRASALCALLMCCSRSL